MAVYCDDADNEAFAQQVISHQNELIISAPTAADQAFAERLLSETSGIIETLARENEYVGPCVRSLENFLNITFRALLAHDSEHPDYLTPAQQHLYNAPFGSALEMYANLGLPEKFYETVFTTTAQLYQIGFNAWNKVAQLVDKGDIDPTIIFKVSNSDAPAAMPSRVAKAIFYATKFEPPQLVHLLVIPYLLAEYQADKVIIMNDNSDPDRKPDLLTLVVREPVARKILDSFGLFVQYTTFQKEDIDLFSADGETVLGRFMVENRHIPMSVTYVAGMDHMKLKTRSVEGVEVNDTPLKIRCLLDEIGSSSCLHPDTNINLAFLFRPGIGLPPSLMEDVRREARFEIRVVDLSVPTNVSATMVRREGRYWLTLPIIFVIANTFGIWGCDNGVEYAVSQEAVAEKAISALAPEFNEREFSDAIGPAAGTALDIIDREIIRLLKACSIIELGLHFEFDTRRSDLGRARGLLFEHAQGLVRQALLENTVENNLCGGAICLEGDYAQDELQEALSVAEKLVEQAAAADADVAMRPFCLLDRGFYPCPGRQRNPEMQREFDSEILSAIEGLVGDTSFIIIPELRIALEKRARELNRPIIGKFATLCLSKKIEVAATNGSSGLGSMKRTARVIFMDAADYEYLR
ncbi:MAG: hypothetical protein NTY47_06020, partial [Candidatus Omnitrophica bacterium]|nr:hypothetical protein [Candidatus Omnitrophota bacterium]